MSSTEYAFGTICIVSIFPQGLCNITEETNEEDGNEFL